ncbi:hypothetical protein BpHYR1_008130 [Brachionus plicatilis]|uniref:Uncharacterized protein n=1 Tax=Brachionus plicatilis TaxID=10195 RepID=A0A3M7R225_BRAPC|nr:hypothetical protein BpHYR1_008130 [Brachionus plicatilis]
MSHTLVLNIIKLKISEGTREVTFLSASSRDTAKTRPLKYFKPKHKLETIALATMSKFGFIPYETNTIETML